MEDFMVLKQGYHHSTGLRLDGLLERHYRMVKNMFPLPTGQ
ncbi:MAG TPA: hypothetical protein PLT27_11530 [Nitrospira sp.]|nr:hypothetical protein [Nitrospira sp.]